MSEYWTPLERLLSEVLGEPDAADRIVAAGYATPENRDAIQSLLDEHSDTYVEDPDNDYDYYCECGKWLEWNNYELPDHQSSLLEDEGLILPEEGPRHPRPLPQQPITPIPAAFQMPRRTITFHDWSGGP